MKFEKKKISIRILNRFKDSINEIFRDFARGKEIYFDMSIDTSSINRIIFDYDGILTHYSYDTSLWNKFFIHYSLQKSNGCQLFEIAKVIDAIKKENIATFTLSIPIRWEEDTLPEDIDIAKKDAASIIRSAKSKAYIEKKKILYQTVQDCIEMRSKAFDEIEGKRKKLNRLSNRIDAYLSTVAKRDCMTKEEELHSMLKFLTLYQDEDDLILYKDEELFRKKIKDIKSEIRWFRKEHTKNDPIEMRINWIDCPSKYDFMINNEGRKWGTRMADYFDDVAQLYAELRPKLGVKTSLTKVIDCYYGINDFLKEYGMKLSEDYVALWDELISTCSSYDLYKRKKKEQKEEEKEIERERIKAEKEYAKAIRQAEKDEVTARRKLEEAQKKLEEQKENEKKSNELKKQIAKLEKALQDAVERGQRALSMAQQTKKGFVYIISNVNSFGKDVFKIGLTRRLDPTERIDELSNASVPFPFQIHAIIESEDAPALEAKLHRIFNEQKMNKSNWRKEFFKITIDDIQKALKQEGIEASIVNDYSLFDYKVDF